MNKTLKEWRQQQEWSQDWLADKLTDLLGRKVWQSHVSSYERGAMPPWDVGDAITKLTGGLVKPLSIKPTNEGVTHE